MIISGEGITGFTKLPRVAVAELYCDAPATAVNAFAKDGVEGIITSGLVTGT